MVVLFLFFLGLFFGSFFLVLVDRLPRGETVLKGRSHCDYCKHVLQWYDLIPLFSFLSTGGRCRYCHKHLSFYYPFLEVLTGVLFAFISIYVGLTGISNFKFQISNLFELFYFLYVISSFIVVFFTDVKYGIIPDKIIFPAMIITFLYLLLSPAQLPLHIVAAFAAFGFFLFLYLITKGKGMGLGDVKLVFWLGLLVGLPQIIFALYLAFIFGAAAAVVLVVTGKKKLRGSTLPFGPFLILGATLVFFYGQSIINYVSKFL